MKKNLEVDVYLDIDGNPTCAVNFSEKKVCIFYRTEKLGCNETCVFANISYNGIYHETMNRRIKKDGKSGTLIPLNTCPLWNKQK